METKRNQLILWVNMALCVAMCFFLTASVWIRKTYGELLLATADREFMNFLENKRSLFLIEVCIPVLGFAIFAGIICFLTKKKTVVKRYLSIAFFLAAVLFGVIGWRKLGVASFIQYQFHKTENHWYDEEKVVIHALGSIDGLNYTNSKEALEENYLNGDRVFECDMILTADQKLVACHDWGTGMQAGISEDHVPTKEVFMNTKIYGKYTPLSIDEIVLFLKEHEDVYIVTDTKSAEGDYYRKEFQEIVDTACTYECEEVLDRIIIQIYHAYMYGDIWEIYPFQNIVYTLYEEGYRGDTEEMKQYAEFCRLNRIDVITMNEDYYRDELNDICRNYGVQLFVHTVNDIEKMKYYLEQGIGVYTDKSGFYENFEV